MEDSRKDGSMDATACVRVHDRGDGLFVLRVDDAAGGHRLRGALAQALLDALSTLATTPGLRALIVESGDAANGRSAFLHGGRADLDAAMASGLYRALLAFPVAVVAAVRGDATGAGFLFASVCDFVVCDRDAGCGFTRLDEGLLPSAAEFDLFAARFGAPMAWDLLYRTPVATAGERSVRGWTGRIASADAVIAEAERLARDLAAQAGPAQHLLRTQRRAPLIAALEAWTPVGVGMPTGAMAPVPNGDTVGQIDANDDVSGDANEAGPLTVSRPVPGVLLVRIGACADALQAVAALEALDAPADAQADVHGEARVLVLTSTHPDLLPPDADPALLAAARRLQRWAQGTPRPVVVALPAAVGERGRLLAHAFDAVVQAETPAVIDGVADGIPDPSQAGDAWCALAASVFGTRLPLAAARARVLGTEAQTVAATPDLCETVPQAQVLPRAIARAQAWAAWPAGVIAEARTRVFPADGIVVDAAADAVASSTHAVVPGPLEIASPVVEAVLDADGIVSVRMRDLEARNLFTPALVQGLSEAFDRIAAHPACKVVVLSGYDRYFSTGGTRETLQDIQSGKVRFTDAPVFVTALRCPVPVIAAMQGHAVGGGLSLGLFADFALFSAESQYLNPYLRYGFTPGGGATLIVPEILGPDLGHEALHTALEYAGQDLRARNAGLAVHPRAELPDRAIALARRLARHPRERLIALKAALNRPVLDRLDAVFAQEIDMHAKSFVGRTDALERIHAHFGPDVVATPVAAAPVDAAHSTNEHDMTQATSSGAPAAPPSRDEIVGELRTLLAQELHLSEHEIGEGVPFVDLGLDSITGVTWVRRINTRFGTNLPATRVYSHPTLTAMTDHVEQALSEATAAAVPVPTVVPAAAQAPVQAPVAAGAQMPSRDDIIGELRTLLAQELHLSEHEIGEGVPFVDLGLDSITGVTWVRRINTRFDLALPATQVYSHPTLAAMAGHVEERLLASAPAQRPVAPPPAPTKHAPTKHASAEVAAPHIAPPVVQDAATPTAWGRLLEARGKLTSWRAAPAARETARQSDAIAIVGMAGQFPQARDIEAYWTNLAEGRLCVEEVPRERWDMAAYYQAGDPAPGKANARWMGCLPDYDRFDPLFFDISPKEAMSMDPQQRVFLQTAWHAIEHAGYNPRALSGSRCGVFVGCGPSDYHLLSGDLQSSGLGFTGNDTSILAARVSYVLNLQGPCLTVETACSSSLVAISVACDNLVNDTCDAAVAGGVGIIATQHLFLKMAQTGMLSPDGRCFTFDQRANGFVPGEAVGALLLKRLADAERDGDAIHGVIHGWGVNQDGKTNGITAPNPDAQARLQQDVYARFGIDPSAIQMVETHGTGTKLGDPIEVEALKRAFAAAKTPASCALGSVKSNIGHCFTAAGVASVIKVLLSLRHATMPPTINYARLNEHIDLKGTPFYINDRLRPWPAPASGARLAAVSSFGFGGTNAHLVIGEYAGAGLANAASDDGSDALRRFGKLPFVLSARSVEQLDAQARQLLDLLVAQGDRIPLARLACTLQTGREAMDERLGVMAGSTDELVRLLRRHLAGESESGKVFRGTARDHRKTMGLLFGDAEMCAVVVDRLLQQRQWPRLLELWTHGLAVDWTRLYGDARPRRLGLPGYPFARQRYWVESGAGQTGAAAGAIATLHPFVHRNVSTLRQHAYASSFRGAETFMQPPEGGEPGTLPASACLEMARAAIALAADDATGAGWRLTDIAWGEPCVSTATGASLSIALVPTASDDVEFEIYGQTGDIERVHCQGRAQRISAADADLQTVAVERSLTIDLPALGLDPSVVVHPWLIESVLRALAQTGAIATDAQPITLASLWVSAPCRGTMTATVAHDVDGGLSAALYDAQGRLCAGWTGLQTASQHEVVFEPAAAVAEVAAVAVAMPAPSAPRLTRTELMRGLRESLARALYLQPADIANDKAFTELGLDSIVGVEWINELNKTYGIRLAAARLYDYPTLDELSTHLEAELAKLAPTVVASAPAATPVAASVPASVAVAASAPRLTRAELMRGLRESLARALYLQPADIANDKAFTELGLDSIVGVEWINELNKTYGIRLAAARLYDYPTLDELSTHLEAELAKLAPPVVASAPAAARVAASVPASVAVAASAPRLTRAELMRGLRESLARALYLQPADIANDKAFTELGLDSIVGVEWINELNKTYGIRLAAARLYDYPTLDELSTHLEAELAKLAPTVVASAPTAATVVTAMPASVPASAPRLTRAELMRGLRESLARALYLQPADIANDKAFTELGLDSIVGVEWINELNKTYGIRLAAARLYDYPTLDELSTHLEAELAKLAPTVVASAPAATPVAASVPASVAVAASAPRLTRAELMRGLRESLARALYLQPADIANDKAFTELGLDSIVGVEWINELNKTYGIRLAAARLYDYPTLDELSAHLEAELAKLAPAVVAPPQSVAPAVMPVARPASAAARRRLQRRTRTQDMAPVAASVVAPAPTATARRSGSGRIAVIGMSGRYPQAGDLAQYWTNLSEGRNAITEVPPSRWDVAKFFDPDPRKDGGIYCKWIGMLDDIESFDPLFFRISPAEAKNMDPQHRLFLEESYRAFEHAGYARQTLSGSKCGVYVGIIGAEYASLVSSAVDITGSNLAIGAARIAYFLNLKGPAIAIDTACSASLVAIHLACQGLLSHETDMALAGGVSVYLHPETYMGMCRAGMLSPDGQCRTFDDRANGFVPGEGVGAVVLKRLEDAERDHDTIYGVILGSAINQDGKTNGITAPSVNSQIELERGLYAEHDIHPETISYVETHGTGTKLGDPIELEALSTVFRERTQKQHFCALGSVKSNIGHASGAAGVASVQKVLLCMKHRTLVPSLNVTKENTLFDFADSPFYVSKTTRPWDSADGVPRRAAVSSFGFSGTNAHLVIEEYLPATTTAPATRVADPLPVVLSARTAGQLKRRVRDLQGAIAAQRRSGTLDLPSIAYTLLEGREALDERLALVVRSIDELAAGLEAFLDGAADGAGWCSGRVQRDEDGMPRTSDGKRAGDLMALAQDWVQGDTLTWAMLNVDAKVRRIALPTYPFAAKRYWVDPAVTPKPATAASAPPATTSAPQPERAAPAAATAAGQRGYRLDPATLASCLRPGDTAAPAAAFLEIVRMSLADAAGRTGTPVLADVVWGQPLRPAPEREIEVALLPQQDGLWAFEIHSAARGAQGPFDEQVHCQGLVRFATTPSLPGVDLAALRGRLSAVARADDDARIETVFRNGHELLVSLRPLQDTGRSGDQPAQRIDRIDAALRATAWLSRGGAAALAEGARPDALQAMFDAKDGPMSAWRWAWVRPAPGPAQQTGAMVVDIDLCDAEGAVVLRLVGAAYDRLAWAPLQADPATAPAQAPTATAPSARPHIALAELE